MILGCLFTDIVAWFIVVACAATLYVHGIRQIRDGADAAQALRPLAGEYAYILFAAGLFNASLFAASILPISTAYTVCEGLGLRIGRGHKFGEAKVFYWLYTLLLIAGGGVILLPNIPLVKIIILSQVVNGIVLPFVLDLHAAAGQQERVDGQVREWDLVQPDRVGDDDHHDRADDCLVCDRSRQEARAVCRRRSVPPGCDRRRENRGSAVRARFTQRISRKMRFCSSPSYCSTTKNCRSTALPF